MSPPAWYAASVVALAVFFAGLVMGRVPAAGYRVSAEVGQVASAPRGDQGPSREPTEMHVWYDPADARQVLADAMRYAEARRDYREPDNRTVIGHDQLEEVAARLTIGYSPLDGDRTAIRISYTGQDPVWSIALVEHLTRDCLVVTRPPSAGQPASSRAIRAARWRVEQARHYEQKARYGTERHTTVDVVVVDETAADDSRDAFSAARTSLSQADHSDSRWRARNAADATGSPSWPAIPVSHQNSVLPTPDEDQASLQREYEDAFRDREQAERDLADLLSNEAHAADPREVPSRWLLMPPRVEARIGGQPSVGHVAALGGLAGLCGVAMAWWTRRLRALDRLNTVADLERLLPLPVIGQLSIDPAPVRAVRLTRHYQTVKLFTTTAELGLGVLLITFFWGVLADSAMNPLLRDDPLGMIPEVVARAWQR